MNKQNTEQLKREFEDKFAFWDENPETGALQLTGQVDADNTTEEIWDFFLPHLISSDEIKREAAEDIKKLLMSGKGRETGVWHYELNEANDMEASAFGDYLNIKEVNKAIAAYLTQIKGECVDKHVVCDYCGNEVTKVVSTPYMADAGKSMCKVCWESTPVEIRFDTIFKTITKKNTTQSKEGGE